MMQIFTRNCINPCPTPMSCSAELMVSADLVNYVEFPAEGHAVGQLHAWGAPGAHAPERFAWLSEAGIFHGHVDLQRTSIPASELDYLPRRGLLPTPALAPGHSHEAPLALVCPCCGPLSIPAFDI